MNITDLFTAPPIMGVTINTVFLHPAVRQIIFNLLAFTMVGGALFFIIIRNYQVLIAVKKAVVLTFFVTGFAYAIHADIVWSQWFIHDYKLFKGLTTQEKLIRMEGGLYAFAQQAKNILPERYQIFSNDVALLWRTEYFLLPKRKADTAQFIIVIADEASHYDSTKRQFKRNGVVIENIDLVLNFARNAYILRRGS